MPIVRVTSTRPNTEVQFYSYPFDFLMALRARHNYDSHLTSTQDGLTRVVEMTFASIEELNAWQNDSERKSSSDLVLAYNKENGIIVTTEVLT